MPQKPLRFSEADHAVADRFRVERLAERFGQSELAEAIGVTRAAVANFEYGKAKVTFAAGFEFCRRLDLNPRWLATGAEPRRPFVAPDELGLAPNVVQGQMRRGVDFLAGYEAVLAKPLEAWAKKNTAEDVVMRLLKGGPKDVARRLSNAELEKQLMQAVSALVAAKPPAKHFQLEVAQIMLAEMKERLEAAHPFLRD